PTRSFTVRAESSARRAGVRTPGPGGRRPGISPQWMAICVFVDPSHVIALTRLDSYIDTQPAVFIDSVFAWRKIAEPLPGVRASLYPMTWAYLYGFGW